MRDSRFDIDASRRHLHHPQENGGSDLRARKPDGWSMITLDDVDEVTVVSGKTDGHLSLTLIGVRSGMPNEIVQDILEVDPDDESNLASERLRTGDGTSFPLD